MLRWSRLSLVNAPFTIPEGHFGKAISLFAQIGTQYGVGRLQEYVHVTDRAVFAEATDLIAKFGEYAQLEAANRADKSRSLGNVVHFCHWRTIERTIAMLDAKDVNGSVH